MKHITTAIILTFILSACDPQKQAERDYQIKAGRVANLEKFGFTNIMESDGRSIFAERNGELYKVDFGLGVSTTPMEMKMIRDGRVVTLE